MKNKICTKCALKKKEEDFSFKNKAQNKRKTICNECQKAYKNKWYQDNYLEKKDSFKESRKKYKDKLRQKMLDFLSNKKCIDCGEEDIVTLEFDHRENKEDNISRMLSNRRSWDDILNEINKCDIRCANCHKRKTAKQFGNYRMFGI